MKKLLIITPVKNSIDLTEKTIRAVMDSEEKQHFRYVVYDDFIVVVEIQKGSKKKYEFFLYEPLIKIKNRYRLIFAFKSRLQN